MKDIEKKDYIEVKIDLIFLKVNDVVRTSGGFQDGKTPEEGGQHPDWDIWG